MQTLRDSNGYTYHIYSNSEFARKIGKSERTLRRMANSGHPAARINGKSYTWIEELYTDCMLTESISNSDNVVEIKRGRRGKYGS